MELNNLVEQLNTVIHSCILYGGDAGGPYLSSEIEWERAKVSIINILFSFGYKEHEDFWFDKDIVDIPFISNPEIEKQMKEIEESDPFEF